MINFDVFGVSPQGYEVHFQLQGEKVYDDAIKLLERMEKDGYKRRGANGHGKAETKANGNGNGEHYCQEHGVSFKKYTKGNRTWYAHPMDSGEWCRGKT